MSFEINLRNLAQAMGTDVKALTQKLDQIGNLANLTTTEKSNLVLALNELQAEVLAMDGGGAQIDDAATNGTSVWSSLKTNTEIGNRVNALVTGTPVTMDTLDELANALGDDPNFATTMATALGNRVRVDTAAQGLSDTQKSNARANIGAASAAAVGDTEYDLVAAYNAAKA